MSNEHKPSTDVIRRVFIEEGLNCIEVGPCPDSPSDILELRTVGENAEFFGKLNIAMSKAFAAELGAALIAASKD